MNKEQKELLENTDYNRIFEAAYKACEAGKDLARRAGEQAAMVWTIETGTIVPEIVKLVAIRDAIACFETPLF